MQIALPLFSTLNLEWIIKGQWGEISCSCISMNQIHFCPFTIKSLIPCESESLSTTTPLLNPNLRCQQHSRVTHRSRGHRRVIHSFLGHSRVIQQSWGFLIQCFHYKPVSLAPQSNSLISLSPQSNSTVSLTPHSTLPVSLTKQSNSSVCLTQQSNSSVYLTPQSNSPVSLTTKR